jgi:hypothetical protein
MIDVFDVFREDPNNLKTLAQLITAYSQFNTKEAEKYPFCLLFVRNGVGWGRPKPQVFFENLIFCSKTWINLKINTRTFESSYLIVKLVLNNESNEDVFTLIKSNFNFS